MRKGSKAAMAAAAKGAKRSAGTAGWRSANRREVAEFFEVALTTVDGWIRKGCPVVERTGRGVPSKFDLRAVAEWLYGAQAEAAAQDPEKMAPQDRKAWYDSESKRVELMARCGELLEREDVQRAVSTAFAAITQDLLAVPDRLERMHGVPADVAARVEEGLCAALDALRDRIANLAPPQEAPRAA
jgi:phage terminase Nu1 subunit (DNA packaging protein)